MVGSIVITSIFPPTKAVQLYGRIPGWNIVVVGDQKTPEPWSCANVQYLSVKDQLSLNYRITKALPWNHYCRKMLGYLHAIGTGAEIIVDTDDDNVPKDNWGFPAFDGQHQIAKGAGFINVYRYFTSKHIWPRGLPLSEISNEMPRRDESDAARVGIWQMLADGDPDVDAIYRLTLGAKVQFQEKPPIVLDCGVWSPFNSQNTAFRGSLFPLLYLPTTVSFRFTDILRSWVAQATMWHYDYHLGFGMATVLQERNPHDYMRDFESELPMYLMPSAAFDSLRVAAARGTNVAESMLMCYETLAQLRIVEAGELTTLSLWIDDLHAFKRGGAET